MSRVPLRILASLILVACASSLHAASPALPSADLVGQSSLDLERFRGQVVLVDFWASWCRPCAESFPWMADLVRRHEPRGLVVVAVNVDEDKAAAERFLENGDWPFEWVFDPEGRLAESFELGAMPTSLLFDREGRLVLRREGFRMSDAADYEGDVVALLEGREPSAAADSLEATTRRLGGVEPWKRGTLADPAMQLDADLLDLEFDDHIYFSKEATSGGRSFGGGGCGCN